MRLHRIAQVIAVLLPLMIASCGESPNSPGESPDGLLVASVTWDGSGLPGRTVEVLGVQRSGLTDDSGIVQFSLPAGTYTVRAHVNTGGMVGIADQDVTLIARETTRVEFLDCVPCASPTAPAAASRS